MGCCTPKCAKWTTISLSVVVLVLGILLAVLWEKLYQHVVDDQLSISNRNTRGFKNWQETPIPMYLEVHLFNWTNADRVAKYPGVKPSFVEMGPYTFYEHHFKENISFNDNDTITFLNKRVWHFRPELTKGSLEDNVTILNPIAIFVTNHIKDEHYLVKRAVNFFFEEKNEGITVTKTVRELLFDGYDDPLITIATKLNISGLNLPFKKFGWFVDRNESATFDGVYNMYDGGDDMSKLGVVTKWNYEHITSYYPDECAIVAGSTGELWYAPHEDDEVSIFASDLCSMVKLHRNGTGSIHGVEGHQFLGEADVFDNGTYYKDSKCFASGVQSGVRNLSKCKFGAPAYASFPHFYLADPEYRRAVDGMSPNPDFHATRIILEPSTGLPLQVNAAFQINLLMRNMDGIDMFAKVKDTMMPYLWFVQKAELSEHLASQAKMLILLRKLGTYSGYGLIGLGVLLFSAFVFITFRSRWKSNDEEHLLNHPAL